MALHERIADALKAKNRNNISIFDNPNTMMPRNIRRALHDVCTKAQIEPINIHALRHTFATRALEAGINIKTLSDFLGHNSIKTTLDLYGHVLEQEKTKEIKKLQSFNI